MLRFSVNRLVVVSPTERRARALTFHPKVTIITGENDTGKSSLIKSLYYAFGAEPRMLPEWRNAASKILVRFTVGGSAFTLLRNDNTFTIFDSGGAPLKSFSSVTNGLGPYLARTLNFGVKLMSQDGSMVVPPPAFHFLPFYFDQDTSWTSNWNGFTKLQQLKNWRKDLVEYHVGLKPNAYYDVKGRHLEAKEELANKQSEAKVLKAVRDQIGQQYEEVSFSIDLEAFQEEIKELLVECAKIQKAADKLKEKLVDRYNAKMELESQIEIVSGALVEINSDYKFLERLDDHVDCPTCGAAYSVSFADIFGIAKDEGRCEELLQRLRSDLIKIEEEIAKMDSEHRACDIESARVRAILEKKREQVELKDLIESESRKKVKALLESSFDSINRKTLEIQQRIDALKHELDSYTSRERRAEINEEFRSLMKRFLFKLSVGRLTEARYGDFTSKILDQGSDQPRALLAYGYAILHLMEQRSSSAYCPIVIDSPIQQEQDTANHTSILEFIRDNQPEGSQLVVGVVDTKGIDFGGDVISLSKKRHVLDESEYESAYAEILPFLRSALEFRSPQHSLL